MHRYVEAGAGTRLWVEELPGPTPDATPLLLLAPANQDALSWPDEFVGPLTRRHRVIRYDHRDTGRSARAEDPGDYATTDLAADALTVLDACEVSRAHLVGMGLGGLLAQLLLLDHADRVRSAVLVCSTALRADGDPTLPGPDRALRRMWAEIEDSRDDEGELDWRVEHRRLLNGPGAPFDPGWFRELERRSMAHAGRAEPATAHTHLPPDGLDRGAELSRVAVPVLVVEAPADPVHPPPHAAHLAAVVRGARLHRMPGMGHAINRSVAGPLASAVLAHTA